MFFMQCLVVDRSPGKPRLLLSTSSVLTHFSKFNHTWYSITNHHGSFPSAPYFINSCTNKFAPAAFLLSSLATNFFTSSLVNSLCNPSEPFSSLLDATTFASAHALISLSIFAAKVIASSPAKQLIGRHDYIVPVSAIRKMLHVRSG